MKILKHLLSARSMAVLLFIMAAAIGTATFIENEYDTITAKELVYNAKWFELVLLLLLLNFINNIKTYQLLKWKKWSVLLLHFGFPFHLTPEENASTEMVNPDFVTIAI